MSRLLQLWWHSRPHEPLYWQSIAVHLLFGLSVFHRPYLPLIIPSYSRFDDVMPWMTWGWMNIGVAIALALLPCGNVFGLATRFFSATLFFAIGGVFASGSGTTSAVLTYTVLAFSSLYLWQAEFRAWLPKVAIIRRFIRHKQGP